ncbi:MAG: hypothetical protein CM1200mP40_06310 [Gammaproteobacteria bacterium]|nr:MAG: hypothetical protein CM1200mP40_06310 [Gammaproteobacteria bacterium]
MQWIQRPNPGSESKEGENAIATFAIGLNTEICPENLKLKSINKKAARLIVFNSL